MHLRKDSIKKVFKTVPQPWLHIAYTADKDILADGGENAMLHYAIYIWDTRNVVEEGQIKLSRSDFYSIFGAPDFYVVFAIDNKSPIKTNDKILINAFANAENDTHDIAAKFNAGMQEIVAKAGFADKNALRQLCTNKSMREKRIEVAKALKRYIEQFMSKQHDSPLLTILDKSVSKPRYLNVEYLQDRLSKLQHVIDTGDASKAIVPSQGFAHNI